MVFGFSCVGKCRSQKKMAPPFKMKKGKGRKKNKKGKRRLPIGFECSGKDCCNGRLNSSECKNGEKIWKFYLSGLNWWFSKIYSRNNIVWYIEKQYLLPEAESKTINIKIPKRCCCKILEAIVWKLPPVAFFLGG